MTDLQPIIDLLAANLGNLTSADGDQFHYVPFLSDIKTYGDDDAGEVIATLPTKIAEGIALLLERHGYLNQPTEQPQQIVTITCAQCSAHLLTLNTARPIAGKQLIEQISRLDPHCSTRHAPLTPDIIRQRIQDQAEADSV